MEFKLIVKKINNTLTEKEKEIFDAWYNESPKHRDYFHQVEENYLKGHGGIAVQKGWRQVSYKIDKKKKRQAGFKYAAAIAILLAIGSLWFFNTEDGKVQVMEQPSEVSVKDDIEIGTDKATLTLEDGSQIALEKGNSYETGKASSNGEQLVYKGGQAPSEKTIPHNVLTIPRGGQFFVALADGTKVWMNSETQLKYPVSFVPNETREVILAYGEAYFEVSPSTEHNGSRFIVHTDGQQVEVLGTEFNIKAYKEETEIATTLVEGKVAIGIGGESQNLDPGQQSKLERGTGKLTITPVDVYDEISWKNGLFSFKNRSLESIMQVLSRWYDVKVVFQNKDIKDLTFNGVFRKAQKIEDILTIIKNTNEVDYVINQKTITMK